VDFIKPWNLTYSRAIQEAYRARVLDNQLKFSAAIA